MSLWLNKPHAKRENLIKSRRVNIIIIVGWTWRRPSPVRESHRVSGHVSGIGRCNQRLRSARSNLALLSPIFGRANRPDLIKQIIGGDRSLRTPYQEHVSSEIHIHESPGGRPFQSSSRRRQFVNSPVTCRKYRYWMFSRRGHVTATVDHPTRRPRYCHYSGRPNTSNRTGRGVIRRFSQNKGLFARDF